MMDRKRRRGGPRLLLLVLGNGLALASALPVPSPNPPRHVPPSLRSLIPSNFIHKRAISSKTKYIAIIASILGTLVILTLGVCLDLIRRRRASRAREEMEEANPREPLSYDRFPVRPGDEPDDQPEQPANGIHPSSTSPGSTRLLQSMSGSSGTNLPQDHQQQLHRGAQPPPPSSFTLLHHQQNGAARPSFGSYEEPGSPPPPFIPRPPGLGRPSEDERSPLNVTSLSRPPSRPPTASAPPAYTPSDLGHGAPSIPNPNPPPVPVLPPDSS